MKTRKYKTFNGLKQALKKEKDEISKNRLIKIQNELLEGYNIKR